MLRVASNTHHKEKKADKLSRRRTVVGRSSMGPIADGLEAHLATDCVGPHLLSLLLLRALRAAAKVSYCYRRLAQIAQFLFASTANLAIVMLPLEVEPNAHMKIQTYWRKIEMSVS